MIHKTRVLYPLIITWYVGSLRENQAIWNLYDGLNSFTIVNNKIQNLLIRYFKYLNFLLNSLRVMLLLEGVKL